MKLKIQGFELELEGSRDDFPLMTQAIGQQVAGLLAPAAEVVEGEFVHDSSPEPAKPTNGTAKNRSTRQRRPRSGSSSSNDEVKVEAINWRHDPEKWGTPQMKWTVVNKSIWLLYVTEQEAGIKELTEHQIAATFNKHFREAKALYIRHIPRELRKLKATANAPVAEDTMKHPSSWYLTTSGKERARELIKEAGGKGA